MDFYTVICAGMIVMGALYLPAWVLWNIFIAWTKPRSNPLGVKTWDDWIIWGAMLPLMVAIFFVVLWWVTIPAMFVVAPIVALLWGVSKISESTKGE